jgi:hypothetical protein
VKNLRNGEEVIKGDNGQEVSKSDWLLLGEEQSL